MKDFLASWVLAQLIAIGISQAGIMLDMRAGNCHKQTFQQSLQDSSWIATVFIGVTLPLISFIPDHSGFGVPYCEVKEL